MVKQCRLRTCKRLPLLLIKAKEEERKAARKAKIRNPAAMAQQSEAPELAVGLEIQTFERLAEDNSPFWQRASLVLQ